MGWGGGGGRGLSRAPHISLAPTIPLWRGPGIKPFYSGGGATEVSQKKKKKDSDGLQKVTLGSPPFETHRNTTSFNVLESWLSAT